MFSAVSWGGEVTKENFETVTLCVRQKNCSQVVNLWDSGNSVSSSPLILLRILLVCFRKDVDGEVDPT